METGFKYTDIVYEYTAIWNSNKTGERNLFYALALIGSGMMFVYYSFAYGRKIICVYKYIKIAEMD